MNTLFLTFGITRQGDWYSIDEVKHGKTALFCPYCKTPLVAKKGRIKAHHFAHEGESCQQSTEATQACQIPTIDRFELLDTDEQKYLERRQKYKHEAIYSWPGMHEAIQRLEVMGLLQVEREISQSHKQARQRLQRLSADYLNSDGSPTQHLFEVFLALEPLVDIKHLWYQGECISYTKIARSYHANKFSKQATIAKMEQAQRFWLDAFFKRQAYLFPEYQPLLIQKLQSLNQQRLYVMEFTGEFAQCPHTFIKVGITGRPVKDRLKEIKVQLRQEGTLHSGKLLVAIKPLGRLEKLIHHMLQRYRIPLGVHQEFFDVAIRDQLLEQLHEIGKVEPYYPPPIDDSSTAPVALPGRKKKTHTELLAEYAEVVAALRANGMSVRKTCRQTGRASATVQKVKKALLAATN